MTNSNHVLARTRIDFIWISYLIIQKTLMDAKTARAGFGERGKYPAKTLEIRLRSTEISAHRLMLIDDKYASLTPPQEYSRGVFPDGHTSGYQLHPKRYNSGKQTGTDVSPLKQTLQFPLCIHCCFIFGNSNPRPPSANSSSPSQMSFAMSRNTPPSLCGKRCVTSRKTSAKKTS